MQLRSILKNVKVVFLDNPLTAGSTTDSRGSKVVDMSGFDSICTFTTLGATTTAVTVSAQTGASTSAADFATVTHNATNISANTTASNGIIAVEALQVDQQYFRLIVNSTGGNVTGGTVALLFNSSSRPTTSASSDVLASYTGVVTS